MTERSLVVAGSNLLALGLSNNFNWEVLGTDLEGLYPPEHGKFSTCLSRLPA